MLRRPAQGRHRVQLHHGPLGRQLEQRHEHGHVRDRDDHLHRCDQLLRQRHGAHPTTDIATLANGTITRYQQASVHGVVTSVWTDAKYSEFGFTMSDPAGGPMSALAVKKGSPSLSTSTVPAIGDYVLVTGTVTEAGPKGGPQSITIHL